MITISNRTDSHRQILKGSDEGLAVGGQIGAECRGRALVENHLEPRIGGVGETADHLVVLVVHQPGGRGTPLRRTDLRENAVNQISVVSFAYHRLRPRGSLRSTPSLKSLYILAKIFFKILQKSEKIRKYDIKVPKSENIPKIKYKKP